MFSQLKCLARISFNFLSISKSFKVIQQVPGVRTLCVTSHLKCSSHIETKTSLKYSVISFYQFQKIESPDDVKEEIETFLRSIGGTGRIYLNKIGINAQMCLQTSQVQLFKDFINKVFGDVDLKTQFSDQPVFPRLRMRNGKLLDGLDEDFDVEESGRHVTAEQWDQMLEQKDVNTLILDVRNGYEWDVGHFQGALRPKLNKFNAFSIYADELASHHLEEKPRVMMYCTGGIRCELFSSMLKERGFQNIHQLHGGVLKYGADQGQESKRHWRGGLFVFDDRMVTSLDGDSTTVTQKCQRI